MSTEEAAGGRELLLVAARAELAEHGHGAISLRAVARRAGLSHAAPKAHFADRAALLTAVATDGFDALAARLRAVDPQGGGGLAALGRAYVGFGLDHPALIDLMFRPSELHPDDPGLGRAQTESIGVLADTVRRLHPTADEGTGPPDLALVCWAFTHGLVVLARDSVLAGPGGALSAAETRQLAERLADTFAALVQGIADRDPINPGT